MGKTVYVGFPTIFYLLIYTYCNLCFTYKMKCEYYSAFVRCISLVFLFIVQYEQFYFRKGTFYVDVSLTEPFRHVNNFPK